MSVFSNGMKLGISITLRGGPILNNSWLTENELHVSCLVVVVVFFFFFCFICVYLWFLFFSSWDLNLKECLECLDESEGEQTSL